MSVHFLFYIITIYKTYNNVNVCWNIHKKYVS